MSIQRNQQDNGGKGNARPYASNEPLYTVDMSSIPISAQVVSDAILSADSDAERVFIASGMLAYSIGALVALLGKQQAAEITYRHADATCGLAK